MEPSCSPVAELPNLSVFRSLSPEDRDARLRQKLHSLTASEPDLWSSPDRARGDSTHGFFQYPAMMVPRVQRRLAEAVLSVDTAVRSVFDPFMGSGTALVSTMHLGLNCYGQDINPLAVLLSGTRVGPNYPKDIAERVKVVVERARTDKSRKVEVDFPNLSVWFRRDVVLALSKIRRAIMHEPELLARRFLWIALAETIRVTSNDRTSTYKLHRRPTDEIVTRDLTPIATFASIAQQNTRDLQTFWDSLTPAGLLHNGVYQRETCVALGNTTEEVIPKPPNGGLFDLVITSPPYGDNTSTVPYGQHSYLPLQWIELTDIDPRTDGSFLRTTQEIDRRALGGAREPKKSITERSAKLAQESNSLGRVLRTLECEPPDRVARVASFYRDFIRALDHIVDSSRDNAYMVWTVGNRNVGGMEIPNDVIISELLANRAVSKVTELERTILFKRMPDRNGVTATMSKERILIFRKKAAEGAA